MTTSSAAVPSIAGDTASSRHASWKVPLAWLALLLVMGLALPFIPVPTRLAWLLGMVLLTAVYTVAILQLMVGFVRLGLSRVQVVLWFVGALVLWQCLGMLVDTLGEGVFAAALATHGLPPISVMLPFAGVNTLHDLALLCAAALGGALLAGLITEPAMVAPICVLIALIDVWGVLFGGIVSQLVVSAPTVAQKAMSGPPRVGVFAHSAYHIVPPQIGAGDYLFMGLLFAALVAHDMNWRGALKLVTPLVILALLSIPLSYRLLHADIMLPGLLFIGFGVFATNTRYFKFSRDEKVALGWAGLFVAALTVGLYFAAPTIVHLAQQGEPAAQHGTSAPGSRALAPPAQQARPARSIHNVSPAKPGEGG